jgi:uncharacterized OB-fold protein
MRPDRDPFIVGGHGPIERGMPMNESSAITPADRATAVFDAGPEPTLRCSHCGDAITDADADCPTCDTPLDWGASSAALRAWSASGAVG